MYRLIVGVLYLMIIKYLKRSSIIVMTVFYVRIGIDHFASPEWYIRIMPPYIPYHLELVYISGVFEVLFGVMLLVRKLRKYAGFGLILLLLAVFPANIYLASTNGEALGITAFIAWLRLPFQALLIAIAYMHSKI
tara:strand:- start:484 stop:888 length:405 start_codon:yes stop_codon:yes gene_type:complete